ncbi:VanZ family protein [Sutcliffiella rhizosphaerae]|uniref:VanZ-like domain-containing protein n=1 Tax=Sutcliffiella rhizosphaerae TaxID=2880967 RepID=A0ABN8AK43_9BACI|nr:VanZ family protein [Sutcliffiella rhizosphaerae]CAG9623260.1 hypothetical protein BACCIP111883_04056 [Sutcliffiella rhizosphaerae]
MKNKNTLWRALSYVAVVSWMALIFFFSSQHAEQSANLSGGITHFIREAIQKLAPEADLNMESLSYFIRKNAHFFAYMILGVLLVNALRSTGVKFWKSILFAFTISVLYAISDEIHQLFVPGRSGQVSDVILDSVGALVGIGIYTLILSLKRSKS